MKPRAVDATTCDGRRIPGGHRFGGLEGWPGEAGFGLGGDERSFGGAPWPGGFAGCPGEAGLLGGNGRSFGGAPWPGGFAGCPCLGLPVLGSDMNLSMGPRESATPV